MNYEHWSTLYFLCFFTIWTQKSNVSMVTYICIVCIIYCIVEDFFSSMVKSRRSCYSIVQLYVYKDIIIFVDVNCAERNASVDLDNQYSIHWYYIFIQVWSIYSDLNRKNEIHGKIRCCEIEKTKFL